MNPIKELSRRGFTIWNINNWGEFKDFVCVRHDKELFLNPNYDKDTQTLAMFYLGIMYDEAKEEAVDIGTLYRLKKVIECYLAWKY